jgi:hypothetical protein
LDVALGVRILPLGLPQNEYVPVTSNIDLEVKTTDGTHPSALREIVLDVDKDLKLNAKGYPTCPGGRFDTRPHNTNAVLKACGAALLGKGTADYEIAFPEQKPIQVSSPLLVFNGGEKGGKVTLLIYTLIKVPAPTAIVTTVTITRKGSGIHSIAKVPVIAGGSGSVLDFDFRLGRTYDYRDKKVGYFEAKCPDEIFKVNAPSVIFKNEAHTPGVAATATLKGGLAVPCTPRG